MQLSVIVLSFIIYNVEILCENKTGNKLDSEDKLTLLGYIHGYKIDQNSALEYPRFLLSPIIVIPAVTRKQDYAHTNNSENEAQHASAVSGKNLSEDDNDIEVNFRQALDRGRGSKTDTSEIQVNEILKQTANLVTKNTTMKSSTPKTTLQTPTTTVNISNETTTELPTTTNAPGTYPNAVYNNSAINSLTITVKAPDDILYPPVADEQWKNFTSSTNMSLNENTTKEMASDSMNITRYPSANETDSPIKGVYPAALYNNAEIDQLSITTNFYTNRSPLPPPQDDRWRGFASLRKNSPTSNEFRPLAGLYYDGFLHKPIKKTQGFVPYNQFPLRYWH